MTFNGTTVTLGLDAQATTLTLEGTEVSLAYECTEATLTVTGSEEGSSTADESSTSEESMNSGEDSSTEEPSTTSEESTSGSITSGASTSESSTTEESTTGFTTEPSTDVSVSQSVYTSDGSVYTTDVEVPLTTPSASASQPQSSANVPTAPAGSLNTACSVVLGPMSGEDVALLEVIFNSGIDGTTYAQWLVNYASQLTRQIDNVAAEALADSGRQYTTAFNTIDITGILGFESAAPKIC